MFHCRSPDRCQTEACGNACGQAVCHAEQHRAETCPTNSDSTWKAIETMLVAPVIIYSAMTKPSYAVSYSSEAVRASMSSLM